MFSIFKRWIKQLINFFRGNKTTTTPSPTTTEEPTQPTTTEEPESINFTVYVYNETHYPEKIGMKGVPVKVGNVDQGVTNKQGWVNLTVPKEGTYAFTVASYLYGRKVARDGEIITFWYSEVI